MTEKPTAQLKRCAYCLQMPNPIGEAWIGTPADNPATGDMWVYLCPADAARFNAAPWPSDERGEFIDKVQLNIAVALLAGTADYLRPPLLPDEVLQLFSSTAFNEMVRREFELLDLTEYEWLRRFPRREISAPALPAKRDEKDEPGTVRREAVNFTFAQRVGPRALLRLQGTQAHAAAIEEFGQIAKRSAGAIAEALNLHACRVLTAADDERPPDPLLAVTLACPWHLRHDTPITSLTACMRGYREVTGRPADRITMSSHDFDAMCRCEEVQIAWQTYRRGARYNRDALMELLGMLLNARLVLTDRTVERYGQPPELVLPEHTVVIDREDDDVDREVRQLLLAPAADPVGYRVLPPGEAFVPPPYGPVGYFTLHRRAEPADVRSTATLRGLCLRLQDKQACVVHV